MSLLKDTTDLALFFSSAAAHGSTRDSRRDGHCESRKLFLAVDLTPAIRAGARYPQSLVIKAWQWGYKRGYGTYVKDLGFCKTGTFKASLEVLLKSYTTLTMLYPSAVD